MSSSSIRGALQRLLLLVVLHLACTARGRQVQTRPTAVLISSAAKLHPPPSRNDSSTASLVAREDTKIQLRLCECERATGAPSGLSCDKEGWFISSWERQGQWVAGGGYVPLSHAICCRPCLPDELPSDPSGRIPGGQAPVAVISLGCHPSTRRGLSTLCEPGARSFVSGYSEAVKVFTTTPDTYYPINTAQCCTPALLLESGDAWELERCGCHDSTDPDFPVNCGGTNTDDLLLGYSSFRLSPLGHVVPVGPAQCCQVCLSGTVHPMNQCDDLNSCSGHGVCNLRRCDCFEGWTGPDCAQPAHNGKTIPPWAIALIVLSSSALAGIFIIAAGYALQALGLAPSTPTASEDGDGDERQPLLLRLDPDDAGSVGSADSTDCEDEVGAEEVERRVTSAIARLEDRVAAAGGEPAPGGPATGEAAAVAGAGVGEVQPGSQGPGRPGETPAVRPGPGEEGAPTDHDTAPSAGAEGQGDADPPTVAAQDSATGGDGCGAGEDADDGEPLKRSSCGPTPEGPLAMVDCVVCMSRAVQVVVVPCGHVCMCRRCSRRLARCPICRKDIARRQRLFV